MTAPPVSVPGPVAVLGLGALGGSLARALKALPAPPVVRAHDLDRTDLDEALRQGVADEVFPNVAGAVRGAAVVVVATPLAAEGTVLGETAAAARADAWVMDVGSLQAPALAAAAEAGLEGRFVACHPLAGSHESGFGASRHDLFTGAPIFLSADAADGAVRDGVEALWARLEARPVWIEADVHDTRMAVVSHLPQVVANALAHVLEEGGFTAGDLGPGGRDMTRLAASSPEVWRDILASSGPQVAALLRVLGRELDTWARVLDGQDLDEVARRMERTRRWRAP